MLGSFAVLLGMYMFIMLMGNLHLEFDDMRQTGLHVRTMIAVYQVLVVSIIIVTHTFFKLFINIVKKDSVSFVLITRKKDIQQETTHHVDVDWKSQTCDDRQAPHGSSSVNGFADCQEQQEKAVDVISTTEEVIPTHNKDSTKCMSDTYSTKNYTEAYSESLSVHSEILPLNIVFDTSTNLDLYVLYVNLIG